MAHACWASTAYGDESFLPPAKGASETMIYSCLSSNFYDRGLQCVSSRPRTRERLPWMTYHLMSAIPTRFFAKSSTMYFSLAKVSPKLPML